MKSIFDVHGIYILNYIRSMSPHGVAYCIGCLCSDEEQITYSILLYRTLLVRVIKYMAYSSAAELRRTYDKQS